MKLQRKGTSVLLTRSEFEAIVRHLKEFEKIVKEFERNDAAGKLPTEWQETWHKLKRFLVAEELEGSTEHDDKSVDGRYCCILRDRFTGGIETCRDYNAWYVFAWAGCVSEAIARGYDATLVGGRCRKQKGCPQSQ